MSTAMKFPAKKSFFYPILRCKTNWSCKHAIWPAPCLTPYLSAFVSCRNGLSICLVWTVLYRSVSQFFKLLTRRSCVLLLSVSPEAPGLHYASARLKRLTIPVTVRLIGMSMMKHVYAFDKCPCFIEECRFPNRVWRRVGCAWVWSGLVSLDFQLLLDSYNNVLVFLRNVCLGIGFVVGSSPCGCDRGRRRRAINRL